ncbi:MAG: hypothetical protein ABW221_15570 [Vicinamibacteria bacterium]
MIRKTTILAVAAFAWALAGTSVRADDWDVASVDDDSSTTGNVLTHGSEQVHDLPATGSVLDEDWYVVVTQPWSSYQMVVDGMTGDLRLTETDVQLLDTAGVTPQEDAVRSDGGGVLSLAWANTGSPPEIGQFVRVQGAACGTACTTDDRYRIRFYDTSFGIARFNNSGTQATVVVVQNVTDVPCDLTYLFFDQPSGARIGSSQAALPPNGLSVLATSTVAPNQSGSIRIVHTCGYGGLSGKAVSVEPATGFAFDTPMVQQPR